MRPISVPEVSPPSCFPPGPRPPSSQQPYSQVLLAAEEKESSLNAELEGFLGTGYTCSFKVCKLFPVAGLIVQRKS